MTSKFVSFLETVGKDFTKFLPAAETAMAIFEPALSPMFNMTVNAVVTAEQSFAAAGKQTGTGTQKLAAVVGVAGPLIAQGLADAGKASDTASVENYVSSVVTILNSVPAAPTVKA